MPAGGVTFAEAAGKLRTLAKNVDAAKWDVVDKAAPLAEEAMLAGPPRVGLGRNSLLAGAPWGVRKQSLRRSASPMVRLTYAGPVHWFEYGTSTHLVVARHLSGSKSRYRRTGTQQSLRRYNDAVTRRAFGQSQSFGSVRSTYTRGKRAGQRKQGARALNIAGSGTWRPYALVRGMSARPFWEQTKSRAKSAVSNEIKGFWGDSLRRTGLG